MTDLVFWFFYFFHEKIMKLVSWTLQNLKYHFWMAFQRLMTPISWFFREKKQKIKKLNPSRYWIFIYLAWRKKSKANSQNIEEINSTKKNQFQLVNHALAIGIWSLDRILTKIIGFRIQILPKCHQKVQLEHYFSQRVFRVRQKQNILGLSTLRALFISEEI